jgi:hypothetical protein
MRRSTGSEAFVRAGAVVLAMIGFGCQLGEPEPEPGSRALAIVGGTVNPGDPAVVMLQTSTGGCTGSLVASTVVLTAAHCIERSLGPGDKRGTVYFGTQSGDWFAQRSIIDMVIHRYYDAGFDLGYDIALVRLRDPAPDTVIPVELNDVPLDATYVGATVRAVGFGGTGYVNDQLQGFGVKRSASITVDKVTPDFLEIGDEVHNTCQGDSGGPHFMTIGGREVQVAVSSFGASSNAGRCTGPSKITRVDAYLQDFLIPVIDAWSGPCQDDAQCVTDGCRTPDPDCDEDLCGFDGYCGTGCVELDLDCPVGGRPGDLCGSDLDCDSRRCVPAGDDPRVAFCTLECDPEDTVYNYGCERPLNSCTEMGGAYLCDFGGPTPSTQGAPCADGGDCRSGLCDAEFGICVEPCGDGQAACADGFECRDRGGSQVCTVPAEDTICSLAHGPRKGRTALAHLALILLALGAVFGRRRSRRRPASFD